MNDIIDLRSDTLTRPSPAMREVMARAEVGDDVYGEDPTVRALEARVCELTGKEAALFVPSGTMSNQLALLTHTRRGDEVIVGEGAHVMWYESGAGAALSGVQFATAGAGGLFTADEMADAVKPVEDHHPRTSLVCVENTHNRGGGRVFPQRTIEAIAERARSLGLRLHLDGARLWNASIATGTPVSQLCAPFDTVSVCFSKGLGAPVGSALCGAAASMREAHRFRKMLGGGMRQAGILAAAALYALEHNRERMIDDHRRARALGETLSRVTGARVDLASVETNIVNIDTTASPAAAVAAKASALGVRISASRSHRLRAVLHLDVSDEQARLAGERLGEAIRVAHA